MIQSKRLGNAKCSENTPGRVESGADLTSGRVDPLPFHMGLCKQDKLSNALSGQSRWAGGGVIRRGKGAFSRYLTRSSSECVLERYLSTTIGVGGGGSFVVILILHDT